MRELIAITGQLEAGRALQVGLHAADAPGAGRRSAIPIRVRRAEGVLDRVAHLADAGEGHDALVRKAPRRLSGPHADGLARELDGVGALVVGSEQEMERLFLGRSWSSVAACE